MLPKFLLVAGIALAPAIGLAQSTPHLYVGASAQMFSSEPFRSSNTNTLGPALTIGYQLSPRWAIQSGASLFWRKSSYSNDYSSSYYSGYSLYDRTTADFHSNLLIIPLLARYTFTDPSNPLHVDALFGASWLHGTDRSTFTTYYVTTGADSETHNYTSNTICANVGPSIRYTLGAHLDLIANSIVQVDLSNRYEGSNFSDRLSLNTQLGIQYSFGK